jgi:hypothetical protein
MSMAAASPGGLSLGSPTMPMVAAARPQATRRIRTGTSSHGVNSYPNGPGWTHAKVQRMAKKRRNVIRNRKAHRS